MTPSKAVEFLQQKLGPGEVPIVARAPGRINIIGEHTDYNDGFVLPFAINRYTEVAIRPRRDSRAFAYSAALDEVISFPIIRERPCPQTTWADYILGIVWEFQKIQGLPHGFDAAIWSNVPIGAGLSSSASLEVAFAVALKKLFKVQIEDLELVQLCQRAESNFVGMPCGIMDQYTAYFAEPNYALLLDTRNLTHRLVPLRLKGVVFLLIDSGVKRALAASGYALRRKECEAATEWLRRKFPDKNIMALRDVGPETLKKVRDAMPLTLWKRAFHVVMENIRVLEVVDALERDDFSRLGQLLFASHESLRDFFEVSIPEVDFLVEWGRGHGALGGRLIGGGFGGTTLHLIPQEILDAYIHGAKIAYAKKFGHEPNIIEVSPGFGAKHWLERQ